MQLINKFSIFLHLVTNICLITASNESFCSDGTIDSAFTLQNETILIRKDKIWFFDSQTNLVNNKSMTFKQLFNDHRIKGSIDAIFVSTRNSDNVLYVFMNHRYYLLAIRNQNPISFGPFTSSEENKVPQKWSIFGNQSLDTLLSNGSIWFPSGIDEAVVLRDVELYLFHGSSIRYAMITNDWPQGRQVDYPFVGPLKDLTKIDAVFRLYNSESKDQIVIVEGFRYCIITQHNTNISDVMNGCKWNDSRLFFKCKLESTTTTTTTTTTSTTTISCNVINN